MPRSLEFTEEIGDRICERLIEGESLRSICRDEDMPTTSTVCKWLTRVPAFAEQYARAREQQADTLFDEILHIADTPLLGRKIKSTSDGKVEEIEGDMIEHRRLQVDARKWMAGKMAPKKYAERVTNVHEGGDKPIETKDVTDVDRAKAMALLATKARRAKA